MQKSPAPPSCVICSVEFTRRSSRQKLCGSPTCAEAHNEQYHRDYRETLRPELNKRAKAAYHAAKASNPEAIRDRNRQYIRKHKDRLNAKRRTPEYRAKAAGRLLRRIRSDPALRLQARMSANIYHALADRKAGRSWESLVGYTVDDLRTHLERQFRPGMTWENWGKGPDCWHIDHIVPKVRFSFHNAQDPDFKACWALTNLRPLWQPENQSKSARMVVMI